MTKILVIEDEAEIRANLLELLEIEGYDVLGADSGITGLLGAIEHRPDLILCDVMMPEIDGYDVLRAIRQEPITALVPFIFLTAFADKGDVRQGMDLGADDYLTKPFTCAEVLGAIETRLKKQILLTAERRALQEQLLLKQERARQLKEMLDSDSLDLMEDFRGQIRGKLTTLQLITELLKPLPECVEINRSLGLINLICASEIKMLAMIPVFE